MTRQAKAASSRAAARRQAPFIVSPKQCASKCGGLFGRRRARVNTIAELQETAVLIRHLAVAQLLLAATLLSPLDRLTPAR